MASAAPVTLPASTPVPAGPRPATGPPLGHSIPDLDPHAVSVSLPEWRDNVDYEEGRERVIGVLQTGYPRFYIHKRIQELASLCESRFALGSESCMLFPTAAIAEGCKAFCCDPRRHQDPATVQELACKLSTKSLPVRTVQFIVRPAPDFANNPDALPAITLYPVFFPSSWFPIAKQYWQHTGDGISSRLANRCIDILAAAAPPRPMPQPSVAGGTVESPLRYRRNRHYSTKKPQTCRTAPVSSPVLITPPHSPSPTLNGSATTSTDSSIEAGQLAYLEERYGRNLPSCSGQLAKQALRRRIAGVLRPSATPSHPENTKREPVSDSSLLQPSERAQGKLTEDDVYLYPCGMSAIFHAHQLVTNWRGPHAGKSVCFGFPYTDTFKILQKWGPGCHFYGHGTDAELDSLEVLLASQAASDCPPIQALFCEFPSNPLLRTPDLARIRTLADQHGFIVVVDETIGNFVNVEVLPFADIVVSSLTKVFSGDSNVMGGSLVLSPTSSRYSSLKAIQDAIYEDSYFGEDAIYLERNSRDFRPRIARINKNAEALTAYLQSLAMDPLGIIKNVHYPKFDASSRHYCARLRPAAEASKPGFGGLFSVTFRTKDASEAFFDALQCHKGPSLGTNFTLACPYTVLAHYTEMDWAAEYGVEPGLIRVSVGLEDINVLLNWFQIAVQAAQNAPRSEG